MIRMQTIAQLKNSLVIINQLEKSNRSTKVKKKWLLNKLKYISSILLDDKPDDETKLNQKFWTNLSTIVVMLTSYLWTLSKQVLSLNFIQTYLHSNWGICITILTSKPQFGSSSLLAGISKRGSSDYIHTLQHWAEKQLVPESQIYKIK